MHATEREGWVGGTGWGFQVCQHASRVKVHSSLVHLLHCLANFLLSTDLIAWVAVFVCR